MELRDTVPLFMGNMHSPLLCVFILLLFHLSPLERAQAQNLSVENGNHPVITSIAGPCEDTSPPSALTEALQLVCERERVDVRNRQVRRAIIIGFLGGYVKRNDAKHPEVLFAKYLGKRYGPTVYSGIFGNHEGKQALEDVIRRLNDDKGVSTSPATVKVILYGHSWGASQTLILARELQRRGIPVALTIQIDSVKKHGFGPDDRTVPANVARAVNFYQRKGLTPGQPLIVAADTTQTEILGNFHRTYGDNHINCDNYRWLSRVFNKDHNEIENDPWIWDQVTSFIDSELLETNPEIQQHRTGRHLPPKFEDFRIGRSYEQH
jgi:hypothetical protein